MCRVLILQFILIEWHNLQSVGRIYSAVWSGDNGLGLQTILETKNCSLRLSLEVLSLGLKVCSLDLGLPRLILVSHS